MTRVSSSLLGIVVVTGLCVLMAFPSSSVGSLGFLTDVRGDRSPSIKGLGFSALASNSTGDTVLETIRVGTEPSGVAYDPGNGYVYVANYISGSVSVINETTVVATVTVGINPFGVGYDGENGLIYVTNTGSGSVSVINGTTIVATVRVGTNPLGVTYNSGNGFVYVTNSGSNSVSVISGTIIVTTIPVGQHPSGVGYDSGNGYIYVTNEPDSTVSVIDGTAVVATVLVRGTPVGVGYDSGNGYIYVANLGSGIVSVINGTVVVATVPVGINPFGVAYNSGNGFVYVTNTGSGTVSVINETAVVATVTVGNNPVGVAYDSGNGYVYVANSLSNTVSVISTAASGPFDYSLSNNGPVTIDPGMSGSVTVTATLTSSALKQLVTLSCVNSSLPLGISCASFTVNPVSASSPSGTSDLKVSVASSVFGGSYSFQVTGSPAGSTTTPTTVIVSVTGPPSPAFDYTLSVNPTTTSIFAGSSTSATVTATLTIGTPHPVVLSLSVSSNPTICQLDSGVGPCGTIGLSPTTIEPITTGATSSLTISTTTIVAPGTYSQTITGSPPGSSSSTATFILTIIPASVYTVDCGRGEFCSIQSNATLSKISFAGVTIHAEADGPSGAHGYANVTIPKPNIPNINQLRVFVGNSNLSSSVIKSSNSMDYFIYFTFAFHSPVLIDIQLSAPENPTSTVQGLDYPAIFYRSIAAIAVLVVLVVALVSYRISKTRVENSQFPLRRSQTS